jgi:putative spermidine/putrescine transport system ATP-binding protein
VRDVVYLGALTRYGVDLDVGGRLVVIEQNLSVSSMQALEVRGRRVVLAWARQHNRKIGQEAKGSVEVSNVSSGEDERREEEG